MLVVTAAQKSYIRLCIASLCDEAVTTLTNANTTKAASTWARRLWSINSCSMSQGYHPQLVVHDEFWPSVKVRSEMIGIEAWHGWSSNLLLKWESRQKPAKKRTRTLLALRHDLGDLKWLEACGQTGPCLGLVYWVVSLGQQLTILVFYWVKL